MSLHNNWDIPPWSWLIFSWRVCYTEFAVSVHLLQGMYAKCVCSFTTASVTTFLICPQIKDFSCKQNKSYIYIFKFSVSHKKSVCIHRSINILHFAWHFAWPIGPCERAKAHVPAITQQKWPQKRFLYRFLWRVRADVSVGFCINRKVTQTPITVISPGMFTSMQDLRILWVSVVHVHSLM